VIGNRFPTEINRDLRYRLLNSSRSLRRNGRGDYWRRDDNGFALNNRP